MKKNILLTVVITIIFIQVKVFAQPGVVADLGVMLKSDMMYSKSKGYERVFAGDEYRLFVKAVTNMNCYAIYIGDKEATLIERKFIAAGNQSMLPSGNTFFQFDSKNAKGHIVFVCSVEKVQQIEELFRNKNVVPTANWEGVEQKVVSMYKFDINSPGQDNIRMAGNSRGGGAVKNLSNKDFFEMLSGFTDQKVIIKKFSYEVKR